MVEKARCSTQRAFFLPTPSTFLPGRSEPVQLKGNRTAPERFNCRLFSEDLPD